MTPEPQPQRSTPAAHRPSEGPEAGPAESGVPPLSIVALDDDPDFRQYIAAVLGADGHQVLVAGTSEAFFALIEASMPDVALLDMKMGSESGEGVLGELRRRWPKLCVIVVTGYPSLDSMRQTFKREVFDYLAKPFSLADLRATLRQACQKLGLGQRPRDRLRTELGRQIRIARTERGWTLRDLSDSCGVSVSQLSSIERGAHLPSVESLIDIAGALQKQPSAWFSAAGF
ncbi:MAG: hypothetical protein C0475_03165 [Planctomyces sp.]|nr:hypothetical protein [Planctomyces sp.]MBA4120718.1 hypothetical protein [Isosphaera sp.]